jgi:hypothetical protein
MEKTCVNCFDSSLKFCIGRTPNQGWFYLCVTCAVAQVLTLERAWHLVQCSGIAVVKFFKMFEKGLVFSVYVYFLRGNIQCLLAQASLSDSRKEVLILREEGGVTC